MSTIVRTVLAVAGPEVCLGRRKGITLEGLAEAIAQITGRVDSHDDRIPLSKRLSLRRQYRRLLLMPKRFVWPGSLRLMTTLRLIFFSRISQMLNRLGSSTYISFFLLISPASAIACFGLHSNIVERRGIRPHLGTCRDQVKGGGARYYWLKNMTANPLVRDYIHFEGALERKQGRF